MGEGVSGVVIGDFLELLSQTNIFKFVISVVEVNFITFRSTASVDLAAAIDKLKNPIFHC